MIDYRRLSNPMDPTAQRTTNPHLHRWRVGQRAVGPDNEPVTIMRRASSKGWAPARGGYWVVRAPRGIEVYPASFLKRPTRTKSSHSP